MKYHKISIIFFLIFIFSSLFAQNITNTDFDSFIKNLVDENQLPGLAIAIIKDDSLIFIKGYGVRKIGHSEPVNEHTLFQAASLTKTFTATLMGMLVDQGKVNWDDPVKKYISDFKLTEDYVTDNLTIRDLLAMRAGILGGDTLQAQNQRDLIKKLKFQPLDNSFRISQTSWNLMYTLAGFIEELFYNKPWEQIVKKTILVPLDMKETFTNNFSAQSSTRNLAVPHLIKDGQVIPTEWSDFGLYNPAESFVTNVHDLAKWIKLLLNQGKLGNTFIIKSEILEEMQNPQMVIGDFFKNIFNPTTNFMTFGLGWMISDYKSNKVIEMGGAAPGTSNIIAMIPSEQIGVVIQTNMNFAFKSLVRIKFHIFDSLLSN
jgi:CubicO group peptidase (beta-lactamase class C family)